jgi:predicted nucleic acid-binding protein
MAEQNLDPTHLNFAFGKGLDPDFVIMLSEHRHCIQSLSKDRISFVVFLDSSALIDHFERDTNDLIESVRRIIYLGSKVAIFDLSVHETAHFIMKCLMDRKKQESKYSTWNQSGFLCDLPIKTNQFYAELLGVGTINLKLGQAYRDRLLNHLYEYLVNWIQRIGIFVLKHGNQGAILDRIVDKYKYLEAPFSHEKPIEFKDAIMLCSLQHRCVILSRDADWLKFAKNESEYPIAIASLKEFISDVENSISFHADSHIDNQMIRPNGCEISLIRLIGEYLNKNNFIAFKKYNEIELHLWRIFHDYFYFIRKEKISVAVRDLDIKSESIESAITGSFFDVSEILNSTHIQSVYVEYAIDVEIDTRSLHKYSIFIDDEDHMAMKVRLFIECCDRGGYFGLGIKGHQVIE